MAVLLGLPRVESSAALWAAQMAGNSAARMVVWKVDSTALKTVVSLAGHLAANWVESKEESWVVLTVERLVALKVGNLAGPLAASRAGLTEP